jgi:hypothetical protein
LALQHCVCLNVSMWPRTWIGETSLPPMPVCQGGLDSHEFFGC